MVSSPLLPDGENEGTSLRFGQRRTSSFGDKRSRGVIVKYTLFNRRSGQVNANFLCEAQDVDRSARNDRIHGYTKHSGFTGYVAFKTSACFIVTCPSILHAL